MLTHPCRALLAAVLGFAVVLAGTADGAASPARAPAPSTRPVTVAAPPVVPAVAPVVEPTPSPTPDPRPERETNVPDSAMIPVLSDVEDYLRVDQRRPPHLCDQSKPASEYQITRYRSAYGLSDGFINIDSEPGPIIDEYVAQYRDESATITYLDELRNEIKSCPDQSFVDGGRPYLAHELIKTGLAGTESMLIRFQAPARSYNGEPVTCCYRGYLAVARYQNLVVAVGSGGWENLSGSPTLAERGLAVGLAHARTLLGETVPASIPVGSGTNVGPAAAAATGIPSTPAAGTACSTPRPTSTRCRRTSASSTWPSTPPRPRPSATSPSCAPRSSAVPVRPVRPRTGATTRGPLWMPVSPATTRCSSS
jgi:hypothetical protein